MRNDAGINGDAQRIEQMAWMLFLKVYDEKENDWELDMMITSLSSQKNAVGATGRMTMEAAMP